MSTRKAMTPLNLNDMAAVEKGLWTAIEERPVGMLCLTGSPYRNTLPMTAFAEPESGLLWFFTRSDSLLAKTVQTVTQAAFIIMSKNQDLQASIVGDLVVSQDPLHREKYWNSVLAAWFPKGKTDPGTTLLCLTCDLAEVWFSETGALKFGWEIAKARLTGQAPDMGGHVSLNLRNERFPAPTGA